MGRISPLHGTKTHPLTSHALAELRSLLSGPRPYLEINPGVIDRLMREDFIETVDLPSPYKVHKGGKCRHIRITPAGRDRAQQPGGA